jgi:L-lactate dehydrogenase (cytochrome)
MRRGPGASWMTVEVLPRADAMKQAMSIEELREAARRRVPRAYFRYVDGGSYAEQTLRANRAGLERIDLRQRVLVDVSRRTTETAILGEKASLPIVLSTVAMSGLVHGDGEILACRAAHEAGVPFILSTVSICSIEDVHEAVGEPFWFQLYVVKDRGFVGALVERAIAARCSALVLTVDLQVMGERFGDVKNGLTVPPKPTPRNVFEMARHPAWVKSILGARRRNFGNLTGHMKGMEGIDTLAGVIARHFDQSLNWRDVEWIRSIWPGKLVIKGILDVEDAQMARSAGAAAIVVSNHGGRQLDGAPSSVSMLPRIADAVGEDMEVMFDGGIRSGQDVMRALALGAKSCLVGRAYVYGLGAGGQAGVSRAIEIIRRELDVTMALTGVTRIDEIDERVLADRAAPARDPTPRPSCGG